MLSCILYESYGVCGVHRKQDFLMLILSDHNRPLACIACTFITFCLYQNVPILFRRLSKLICLRKPQTIA